MDAVNRIESYLRRSPDALSAQLIGELSVALERDEAFPLDRLYQMNYEAFELSLALLTEWRTDRYFARSTGLLNNVKAATGHGDRTELTVT